MSQLSLIIILISVNRHSLEGDHPFLYVHRGGLYRVCEIQLTTTFKGLNTTYKWFLGLKYNLQLSKFSKDNIFCDKFQKTTFFQPLKYNLQVFSGCDIQLTTSCKTPPTLYLSMDNKEKITSFRLVN